MTDNSNFTAELKHEERGNGILKLFYAAPPIAGALLPWASQLLDAGRITIFTSGPSAGNYLLELSRECLSHPGCIEAAKNPLNILPILIGFAGGVVVDMLVIRAGNVIKGTFHPQE